MASIVSANAQEASFDESGPWVLTYDLETLDALASAGEALKVFLPTGMAQVWFEAWGVNIDSAASARILINAFLLDQDGVRLVNGLYTNNARLTVAKSLNGGVSSAVGFDQTLKTFAGGAADFSYVGMISQWGLYGVVGAAVELNIRGDGPNWVAGSTLKVRMHRVDLAAFPPGPGY